MARGYMGKILWVDLSKREFQDEVLDEKFCRDFIGGYGFAARLLFSRQKSGVDPLGPDNIFGISTGPLTATPMLSASRYTVTAKSPLTGGWGDANSGGYCGPQLKFAGYDAVFFTGTSEKPVYLFIDNGKTELRDAAHLWGKDTFETEDILKSELGKDVEAICVGPAGEKKARIAAVMNNKGRAAGRSGIGAVMGSKMLKAVALRGNMKVPVADEQKANELRKKYLAELGGAAKWLGDFGTAAGAAMSAQSGDSPVKNWGGVGIIDFPDVEPIKIEHIMALRTKKYACYRCPIGCGGHMKEGTGEYKYQEGAHKPEYETMAMFGSNCLNNNLESIIKANDICNRLGLDTISAGATIAFAMECYENGLITKNDTDGIEMTWGNHKSLVAMTEKLGMREGFGDILADGVKIAAERIGKGADQYAMHIQGEEVPAHDPKLGYHFGITYRMDATPARHTQGPQPSPKDSTPPYDRKSMYGRGKPQMIGANFTHILNCAGVCSMIFGCLPSAHVLAEFMSVIMGWDMTTDELIKTGGRIADIRQAFNIREGLYSLQFKVPGRIIGNPPLTAGPTAGVTVDEKAMDREFLIEMDWDTETAKPSKKRLLEMGLEDVARELWP